METPSNTQVEDNDESQLDKELEESLNSIKADTQEGAAPAPKPETEEGKETPPEPSKEEQSGQAPEVKKEEAKVETPTVEETPTYRVPKNKGKFESEEAFQKRVEMSNLYNQRKMARTEEEKQRLSGQIDQARKELGVITSTDRITNSFNNEGRPNEEAPKPDETQKPGATKDDIAAAIQDYDRGKEVTSTLQSFVNRHPELKNDPDAREVFFDFVDSNYKWDDKVGKDLMTVLELAHESMFKPEETIQERVLKGADVQEKVNAMQFPGGTNATPARSKEMQKSIDELKSTGMSEEKALELLSDE